MYIRNPETNEWEEVFLPPTGDTFPIGMYGWFAGENAPTNWLRCDGQAVSRTEYKDLFDAIGTTYGAGDGSTTFNLPNVNLENRTLVGSSGDGEFSVGNTGGEKEHALTSAENGPHTHNLGYDYLGFRQGTTSGIDSSQLGAWTLSSKQTTSSGNGTPHNNMQPYMASVCCIKAKQSAGIIGDVTTDIHDTNDNAVPNTKTVKEYVDKKQTYSTDEIVIGTYLNKPLYRKVINMGNLVNNSSKNVAHNLSNFVIRTINGSATNDSVHIGISGFNDEVYIDKTNVIWNTKANRSSFTAYVVLEYTKTTD